MVTTSYICSVVLYACSMAAVAYFIFSNQPVEASLVVLCACAKGVFFFCAPSSWRPNSVAMYATFTHGIVVVFILCPVLMLRSMDVSEASITTLTHSITKSVPSMAESKGIYTPLVESTEKPVEELMEKPVEEVMAYYHKRTLDFTSNNSFQFSLPVTDDVDFVHYNEKELRSELAGLFSALPKDGFDAAYKNPCWRARPLGKSAHIVCLPYVYLLGQPKCGSSDLYYRITQHSHVVAAKRKEIRFFTRGKDLSNH